MDGEDKERLWQLRERVYRLLDAGEAGKAIQLAELAPARYPKQAAQGALWAAGIWCIVGAPSEAIDVLARALEAGCWWWEQLVLNDAYLVSLHERDDFRAIVHEGERRRRAAAGAATTVVHRPDATPTGVVVVLHGAADHVQSFARLWQPATDANWLVVVPQSTQATTCSLADGAEWHTYGWADEDQAKTGVLRACTSAVGEYSAHVLPKVLAGFSMGARMAGQWSLGALFDNVGFFGLCPPRQRLEAIRADLPGAARRKTRAYLLTGERDAERPGAVALHAELQQYGVRSRLEVMDGVGHAFPPDFGDRLREGLTWLTTESRIES